jgi:4-hydroxy-2-oxoheptanedioate aldolase
VSAAPQDPLLPERLNHLITKLEQGDIIVGGNVRAGSREGAPSTWDFVWIDMEHTGFDLPGLEVTLQFLLNRRQILEQGTLAPAVVPMVRIPAYGREVPDWMVKQVLDYGAYGILFPHTSTVEQARRIVRATRYPSARGDDVSHPELSGLRGTAPSAAMRWWGIPTMEEYHSRAGVWPLDPGGEIMTWILIENVEGLRNLSQILEHVPVAAVIAAEVDMATSMGLPGQRFHPEVEAAMNEIVSVCKEYGVAVGGLVTRDNVAERVREGWQVLLTGDAGTIEIARRTQAELPRQED